MKLAMSLVGALRFCACGAEMLLLAQVSLAQTDITTGANGADSTGTGTAEMSPAENDEACLAEQSCIDRYLWSLYERTPKIDAVKVPEQTKATVKYKGKTRTVTKTITKIVSEDFAWKDPKAAEMAEMPIMDYVIGGMEPAFKVTLYRALRALDDAGFKPGIMCAFRDDYRQSIATGLKAQDDRSYHGGSFRGGYGHGMAADIVSVKGETRTERLASSVQLWSWIDDHEKELGIGRPYLDRDPPHVAPVHGQEYADHRIKPKTQRAESDAGTNRHLAANNNRSTPKRTGPAKPSSHAESANGQGKTRTHSIDRDPPHVAPVVDGKEHAGRRIQPKTQHAESDAGTNRHLAVHSDLTTPKRMEAAKPSRSQAKTRTHSI
jgi:hypothetical protein